MVSAPVALGHTHVVPHLAAFLQAWPEVQLDLCLNDGYVDLVADGVMLALRIGQMKDSSLVAHKILENRRILVASKAYLALSGTPTTIDELGQHACIVSAASQDGLSWRLFSQGEQRTLQPRGRVTVDNADAARRHALLLNSFQRAGRSNKNAIQTDGAKLRELTQCRTSCQ